MRFAFLIVLSLCLCTVVWAKGSKPPRDSSSKNIKISSGANALQQELKDADELTQQKAALEEEDAKRSENVSQIKEETALKIHEEMPGFEEKREQHPSGIRIHKVWLWQESRDCLWNMAKKYYGDPWLWKEIYLANEDKIEDPRIIFPKQELVIPPIDGIEK